MEKFKVGDRVDYIGGFWSIPKEVGEIVVCYERGGYLVNFRGTNWVLNDYEMRLSKESRVLNILRKWQESR